MLILLTGSAGYVGSVLKPKLIDAGHVVQECDIGWFNKPANAPEDVRHRNDINGADCVIHLAAISNDPSVAFYPRLSWETSCLATMRLAHAAANAGARFIYASSVSVYGADRGMVTEDMDLQPVSDYNKTKMCAERILMSYYDKMPVQIIRPATICGLSPRMRLDLTVNMLTMQALTKGVMTLHGGQQMRPSIHIDDMCDLYLFMLDHPQFQGVYNAGFENHSLADIAMMVQWYTGAKIDVTAQRDGRSYQVNSDKLQLTGFERKKWISHAIGEIVGAWRSGALKEEPQMVNLTWMEHLGIKDV